ncbi:hypothetical protein AGOR_G00007810 [Albula goreensis]|uniref:Calpastatin n=1 Tax=Albula goreensis TaxID=1534307 RepID=A0A8T3E902_9TELE|nr:hypothetical protein AGOR_G00007810 [Albula goreensis]
MGQILSWIRGPRDSQAVQDVAVEQQSQPKSATSTPVAQVSTMKPAEFEKAATSSSTATASQPTATTTAAGTAGTVSAAGAAVKPGAPGATTSKESPTTAPVSPTKAVPKTAGGNPSTAAVQAEGIKPKEVPKEAPKSMPMAQAKVEPAKVEPPKPAAGAGKVEPPKPAAGGVKVEPPKPAAGAVKVEPPKPAAGAVKVEPPKAAAGGVKVEPPKPAAGGVKVEPPKPAAGAVKVEPPKAAAGGAKVEPPKPAAGGVKVEPPKPAAGAAKVEPPKPAAGGVKVEPPKPAAGATGVATVAGAVATKGKPEVQVEVGPSTVTKKDEKHDVDPFAALADSLPSSKPLVPTAPVYTGPEVKEHGITTEEGILCGEDERTLPPGYRFEDMDKNIPPGTAEVKPMKPMSTDEALDSLSFGFVSTPPPSVEKKEPKVENVAAIDALSAGFNFAPPPPSTQKKAEDKFPANVQSTEQMKSPAPPADKKAKVEKAADDFSLMGAMGSPKAPADSKAKTDEGASMSLDALSALGDTLAAPEPAPEPPKIRPEDIVQEDKLKAKKGVRVGEKEDSIPPEYRFKEEKLKDLPPPKKRGEALDLLSGDFATPAAAPVVQAPVVTPAAPPKQPKVEELKALDELAGDFVAPTKAASVLAPVVPPSLPPQQKAPPTAAASPAPTASNAPKVATTDEGASMSLDALSALGDTLAAPEPAPEPPKIRPEDIVQEDKLKSKKGVRVGEREDSIPPEYRFKEEKLKDLPPPKKEPSLDTGEALDLLSGDFDTPAAAPVVQAPVATLAARPKQSLKDVSTVRAPAATSAAPSKQAESDFALDALAGDFVSSAAAPTVQASVAQPAQAARQLSSGTADALDALSETLMDSTPAPEPAPLPVKDIVKEKKIVEEKLIKMGERDDSLPPEFRPSEKDKKEMEKAKAQADVRPKEKLMDDTAALDLLSSDFSSPAAPPAAVPSQAAAATAPQTQLAAPTVEALPSQAASGAVLDALSDTLLPNTAGFQPKDTPVVDKPKVKTGKSKSRSKKQAVEDTSATDELSVKSRSLKVPSTRYSRHPSLSMESGYLFGELLWKKKYF